MVSFAAYGELRNGDKVICVGGWQKPRMGKLQRLEFESYTFNMMTGKEWITCWGIRDRQEQWLYFKPHEIRKR